MVPRAGRTRDDSRPARGPEGRVPEQVLYLPDPPGVGERARVEGGEADHARRSLRVRSGDPVFLVDGRGCRYEARVTGLGKGHLEVQVLGRTPVPVWPERRVTLAAGVLRSTRMDVVVEKASELGVSRFVPLVLHRSMARPGEEGAKTARWRRLAVESLKQCRRARLMEVEAPQALEAFLEARAASGRLWVADPGGLDPREAAAAGEAPGEAGPFAPPGPESSSAPQDAGKGSLTLVVGPEGGLTPGELELLASRGAVRVGLGGHRLRAETAGLALLVAALAALGELGGGR